MNIKFNFEPTDTDYEILKISEQFLLDTLKDKKDLYKLNMNLISRKKIRFEFHPATLYFKNNPYRFKLFFSKDMLTVEFWELFNWFKDYPYLQSNKSDFNIQLYVFLHEFSHLAILLNDEALKE